MKGWGGVSRRGRCAAATVLVCLVCAVAAPAATQDPERDNPQAGAPDAADAPYPSREAALAAERAAKAQALHPYQPNRGERLLLRIRDRVLNPPAVYMWMGSVHPGGLLAIGPGVRRPIGDTGLFTAHTAWSLRNYKTIDARLTLPAFAARRIAVDVHGNWLDAPSVSFHGIGNDSPKGSRSRYLYRPTTAGLGVRVSPFGPVAVGGNVDYLAIDTGDTRGTAFSGETPIPGLGTDPAYVRAHAFAEIDWRDAPGYSRRGGLYRVDWFDYRQQRGDGASFRRVDAEVRQLFPILRENWVIALRGLASITDTGTGEDVPFFLLPSLGGSSVLRGYPSWRFRDRHRLLFSGEYRWTPSHFLDMALFYDTGKVAGERRDLDADGLKRSYGIGMRFHAPHATVMRVELARTGEGLGLVLAFSPSF